MSDFKSRFNLVDREQIVQKSSECLWNDIGTPGREYLLKDRGLSEETIREFQLGYLPKFVKHQLRGRIIFPIFDASGNLIAVSSRSVEKSDFLPVYWHERYEKSFYLFGANLARPFMRKFGFAVVVEGQFDVLQLHSCGVKNVVGLCGNKMTSVQMSVLQRYCGEIVLLLDADENQAGQTGANSIVSELSRYEYGSTSSWQIKGFPTPVTEQRTSPAFRNIIPVTLPENSDPDEYVRKHGVEQLKKIVKGKIREFHNNKSGC